MKTAANLRPEVTVVYQVKDRKATADWYKNHLGFELAYDVEEIGWCELKSIIGDVYIGLSEVESPKVEGGPTLTWSTTDIDADYAALSQAGIKFDGEIQEIPGMVKLATFYDLDGNHLMLAQSLQNPA